MSQVAVTTGISITQRAVVVRFWYVWQDAVIIRRKEKKQSR